MSDLKMKETQATSFVFISAKEHFSQLLKEACEQRRVQMIPHFEIYLVDLLQHYISTHNLYVSNESLDSNEKPIDTFAELYLTALNSEEPKNVGLMKTLADKSLYISGFFGASLSKKTVDIDYYMNMGILAYSHLSSWAKTDSLVHLYRSLSKRFIECVDVLSYISEKSQLLADNDVLSLYERYLKTGSKLAQDKLNELGVVTVPKEQLKLKKI